MIDIGANRGDLNAAAPLAAPSASIDAVAHETILLVCERSGLLPPGYRVRSLKATLEARASLIRLPPPSTPSAKILIVDDHGIVRDGIALLLERNGGMRVVGCAINGADAVHAAGRLEPDIILMDLVLPDLSGIDATVRILGRRPLTRIIVMSSSHSSEHVYRALRVGARGYVAKDAGAPEFVQAVKTVLAGGRYVSAGISASLGVESFAESIARSPLERLSLREREVMHRTVAGASSTEIGRQMSVSPRTVDTYRSRLMVKLGVRDRSALIRFAIEHGLTPM